MWTLTDNYEWEAVRASFSWIRDMEGVSQDPRHHAEGDVAVHTRMVLEALQGMPEFQTLPMDEQELLKALALLHDVEKRSTTVQESDGSITARGHAKKGAQTTRRLLFEELPAPFAIREELVALVRYHGWPIWAIERPDSARTVIQSSLGCNTQHLAMFAKADVLGRKCDDAADLLYRIGLFEELCKEYDCWGKPYAFADAYSQFVYFSKQDSLPDYAAYDDTRMEVVMLSGLPGMGKDTYIRQHLADWPVVSLDALRAEMGIKPTDKKGTGRVVQAARDKAREHLRARRSFVLNATSLTLSLRQLWTGLFREYGARIRIVYLETDYATWQRQNAQREAEVPKKVLKRMLDSWDVPQPWEGHAVEYRVGEA
ncbi:MAG TPA: poly(A) polymerase [Cytophagales bacterium]|nr:poly(A) polymerase [Cytophagales bacterium]